MNRNRLQMWMLPITVLFFASGCATTRAHKPEPAAQDPQRQIADLQSQLVAKDQEITDLRYQLESSKQALPAANFSSANTDKFNILRVSGVSATDVQNALVRAGFDPGPVDGRLGKKTRSAVKAFQKRKGLMADGVVGKDTWAALKSS